MADPPQTAGARLHNREAEAAGERLRRTIIHTIDGYTPPPRTTIAFQRHQLTSLIWTKLDDDNHL